jgi:anthranilate synthase component I
MKLPKIDLSQKPNYIKLGDGIDFYQLFENIESEFDNCFIFESLGEGSYLSRYSLMGFDPQHIISGRDKEIIFDDQSYEVDNPYLSLREIVPQEAIARNYAGGLVGYLSYEAINFFEPTLNLKIHDKFDQFLFGAYLDGLVLDKMTNEVFYFYYDINRVDEVKKIINTKAKKGQLSVKFLQDTLTKDEHKKIVEEIQKHILDGNTFQCQVSFASEFEIKGETISLYRKLRQISPSPFMYYLKFGDKKIIGASPELLFKLRNGEMETNPLAGTIKRGQDEAEDGRLARTLLNDPKEIAEHNMLVDLHRNDIGRVAQLGSVKVRNLMDIKKSSHVQHISSDIVGLIKPDSALASNFPTGTLSGAPKIESIKIIDSVESQARGPYGGAVGHFGFNGDCTFAIAIRSLFISEDYGYIQAGGGIVYDSVAENEYEEIQRKLAALREVLIK